MDSPPPSYASSSTIRSSHTRQDQLGASADALLRVSSPRSVMSGSTISASATSVPLSVVPPSGPPQSQVVLGLGPTPDASLRSSLARSLSRTSIAASPACGPKASPTSLGAAAETLLRSTVARSISSPVIPSTSKSMSRSSASPNSLGAAAENLLRSPVPRSASSPVTYMSSSGLAGSDLPPSYSTSRASAPSAVPASRSPVAAAASSRPPVVGSTPSVTLALPAHSRSSSIRSPSSQPISAAESKRRVRQMQSAVVKVSATAPSRNTNGLFKAACSTDLLFLMDTTSSMGPYIDAAKEQVRNIMAEIQRVFLGECVVRVAVVGYKDHCNSPNIEFLDFTESVDQARDFLGKLRASGGEGWTADALGGIQQASNATWLQQTRCIIHIADAPGHSRALHDMPETRDNKYYRPGSEPHGLTYDPLIRLLVKLNVNYTFLNIHSCTNRMVSAFSRVYDAAGADSQLLPTNTYYNKTHTIPESQARGHSRQPNKRSNANSPKLLFQELPMGIDAAQLHRLVLKSVTDSVTRTSSRQSVALSSSSSSSRQGSGVMKSPVSPTSRRALHPILSAVLEVEDKATEVLIEAGPPQWNSPNWLDKKWDLEGFCPEVVVYSDSTLADIMASDDNIKLSFAQLTVHARSMPFGRGLQRAAHYARIAASASRFVVKSFICSGKSLEHLIEDMRIQVMCKAFALEFNGLVRPEQSIDFLVTACLQTRANAASGEERDLLSLEPFLAGNYDKYNSNGLWVKEDSPADPFNRVAQAFSHFTFERSWGHFMVVDLQGVGNLLTDPVIHTLDPNRFKLNDLNFRGDGFKSFFALHECNPVCQQLGLVSNRDMAISGSWQFRQRWPAMEPTVCCSNKFCQSIVRLVRAHESPKFPGYRWCPVCWPQLQASMIRWICAAPGEIHEFDVCRFFHESQGRLPPRKCPAHEEKDMTVASIGAMGGRLWSQMKTESTRSSIAGNEY